MTKSGFKPQSGLVWKMVGISAAIHAVAIPWAAGLFEFDAPPASRVRLTIRSTGETRTAKVAPSSAQPKDAAAKKRVDARPPGIVHLTRPKPAPKTRVRAAAPPSAARTAPSSTRLSEGIPPAPTVLRTVTVTGGGNPPPRKPLAAPVALRTGPEKKESGIAGKFPPPHVSRNETSAVSASKARGHPASNRPLRGVQSFFRVRGRAERPLRLRVLKKTAPAYPAKARSRGEEGVVLLRLEILPDGRVGKIEVAKSSGFGLLDRAAARSVSTWQFAFDGERPARNAWAKIPIRFQIVPR